MAEEATQETTEETTEEVSTLTGAETPDTPPAEETTEEATQEVDYAGLDEGLFEEGNLSKAKVKEALEKITKQRDDFQKTLSAKGQVPKNVEDYYTKYENEKYSALKDNEQVAGIMQELAETYKDLGISPKQGDKIYDKFFEVFEKTGQVDTRTQEQINADNEKWIKEEKSKLGEEADNIISGAVNFVKGFNGINESAKDKLVSLMNSKEGGAELISALYSISRLSGKTTVPVQPKSVKGIPTDAEFAKELKSPDITEERRKEIYDLRASVGRTDSIFKL